MSKRNHKHFLLAVLAVSPLVAFSPSQMVVKRTMASIDQEGAAEIVRDELKTPDGKIEVGQVPDKAIKADIIAADQDKQPGEEVVKEDVIEEATKKDEVKDVVKSEDSKEEVVAEKKEEKKEEERRECSARDDIENLEKDVKKVVAENLSLISRFEKLNDKYAVDFKKAKEVITPAPQMSNTEMLLFGMLGMLLQNQQSYQAPTYSFLPSAFNNSQNFTGPGWTYLPSSQNQFRSPGSLGYSSWETEYYNIPSMGFVNPELTPKANSLTTGLYPSVYSSNGQGRALRPVSELAPARGYQPSYLSPDATSLRQSQTQGISF